MVVAASRIEGVAPLAVFFDASETTGLEGGRLPARQLLLGLWRHECRRVDDDGVGAQYGYRVCDGPTSSRQRETYEVTTTVIDRIGRSGVPATLTITVGDPEDVYEGTNTRCVSQTGDFAGAPQDAEQVTSNDFAEQVAWVNGGGQSTPTISTG